jgi:L-threonylcarbamoyladenylate synthase
VNDDTIEEALPILVVEDAVSRLRRGEVVAFPTESSFGLGVDARSEAALARLFALKQREPGKPPPILLTEKMVPMLVARVPERATRLMQRFWPGALTLVLPARADLPEALVHDGGVGVRVSPNLIATTLVRAFGGPITATSANLSGRPPAMTAAEAREAFPEIAVVDGEAGGHAPSTVVRVGDDGGLTILRAGAIDPKLLEGV